MESGCLRLLERRGSRWRADDPPRPPSSGRSRPAPMRQRRLPRWRRLAARIIRTDDEVERGRSVVGDCELSGCVGRRGARPVLGSELPRGERDRHAGNRRPVLVDELPLYGPGRRVGTPKGLLTSLIDAGGHLPLQIYEGFGTHLDAKFPLGRRKKGGL